jgi:hypothetical protein
MNQSYRKNLAAPVGDFVHIEHFKLAKDISRLVFKIIGGYFSNAITKKH